MKTAKEYINLLPRKEKAGDAAPSVWSLGAALFAVLWLALFGLQAKQWWDIRSRAHVLAPRQASLEQELAALRASLGLTAGGGPEQAALVQSLLKERVLWSEVFLQFSHIIPGGVWFDSLEGSAADTAEIRIRGGAFNYRLISDFMLAMEKTDYFSKPELIFAQKTTMRGRDVVAFELRCNVNKSRRAR